MAETRLGNGTPGGTPVNYRLIYLLICCILLIVPCSAQIQYSTDTIGGIGYYKAEYVSDTIPAMLEAETVYPVVITFQNRGMVSWEWGVEKFGLLYQGLQSSIQVDPIFSPIPEGDKIATQETVSFPFRLTPPEKPGEYDMSFSMSTRKGEARYEPFPSSFTKRIIVIPKEGVSSGDVGSIIIRSEPIGASVSMGNEQKGATPLTLPDLNPAVYEITVSHPDFSPKWTKVEVKPGSVSRVFVDLTSPAKPEVSTEQLMKFTPLGWLIDNISLIIISILILFIGFQVLMMDTRRIPEHHPLRRITRPITVFSPSADVKGRFRRGGTAQGKTAGGDIQSAEGGVTDGSATGKTTMTSGTTAGQRKDVTDKKTRRDGPADQKKTDLASEEEVFIDVEDPDQEGREMDGMWGFPHALRDRYEPLGVAGDDPYARVYKVMKKDSGDVRALKVGHMKHAGSEILQKETAVWRSLRHPNIVRLFRSEFMDDLTYLENEYLEGIRYQGLQHTSLSGLPKPLREQYAVSLIRDIAEGLKYAHKIGVRHYHLQTGDILLTPKLRAKLSGFARGRNELGFSVPDSEVKESGVAYITPEQKNGERFGNPGRRTDIYQLGVIFYELLTGYLPYSRDAFINGRGDGVFEDHTEDLVLPSEIRPSLEKYDPLITRMLSLKKRERYDYVDEFLSDLDNLQV